MPKINQQLLERLKSTLGVNARRVYDVIADKATDTMLDRHLAAFVVASENGINIQKYSTPEERLQIRNGLRSAGATSDAVQPQQAQVATRSEPRYGKQAKAKRPVKTAK